MENALENKAKLFAIYYGQRVLCVKNGDPALMPLSHWNTIQTYAHFNDAWLQLKSLASITDEDAAGMPTFNWPSAERLLQYYSYKDLRLDLFLKDLKPIDYDYLRSKGYALPWMGLSVEKQIEYNWIKI